MLVMELFLMVINERELIVILRLHSSKLMVLFQMNRHVQMDHVLVSKNEYCSLSCREESSKYKLSDWSKEKCENKRENFT